MSVNESKYYRYWTRQTAALINQSQELKGKLPGLSTGLSILDEKIDGYQRKGVYVLGARPSIGKTAFALTSALHCSKSTKVGFISLEQPAEQLGLRILAQRLGRDTRDIRRGNSSHDEYMAIMHELANLQDGGLIVSDPKKRKFWELITVAAQMKEREDVGIIFVDYLQLAQGNDRKVRDQEIAEITRAFVGLAHEFEIPVVLLSQINRAAEQTHSKKPSMANLRESGAIEQDADVVLLLHRDHFYHMQDKPLEGDPDFMDWYEKETKLRNKAQIIIAKNRHGPAGETLDVHFDGPRMKFTDLDHHR